MGDSMQLVIACVERKNSRTQLAGVPCAFEQHLGSSVFADDEECLSLARCLKSFESHRKVSGSINRCLIANQRGAQLRSARPP